MEESAAQSRSGYERLTAEQMDEQRVQSEAYQYLCRLEEAKRWMEACLQEQLPAPTELEEALRNGVFLAKLGHCFCPRTVPLRKIYDPDQQRYQAQGLQFRHTDNINHWRNAMVEVGLPAIFHPETTDIYDKKNMPRAVYCIHALRSQQSHCFFQHSQNISEIIQSDSSSVRNFSRAPGPVLHFLSCQIRPDRRFLS
ncbi:ras GTPase-activating-like protein IQGAP3 [Centroberyx affinis]|uniref:ras GTPase-activating-like protein IQGAP3 n=1 Tax=Centroberyx affinis TaxID=166261 RepID=UPI003A5C02D3